MEYSHLCYERDIVEIFHLTAYYPCSRPSICPSAVVAGPPFEIVVGAPSASDLHSADAADRLRLVGGNPADAFRSSLAADAFRSHHVAVVSLTDFPTSGL